MEATIKATGDGRHIQQNGISGYAFVIDKIEANDGTAGSKLLQRLSSVPERLQEEVMKVYAEEIIGDYNLGPRAVIIGKRKIALDLQFSHMLPEDSDQYVWGEGTAPLAEFMAFREFMHHLFYEVKIHEIFKKGDKVNVIFMTDNVSVNKWAYKRTETNYQRLGKARQCYEIQKIAKPYLQFIENGDSWYNNYVSEFFYKLAILQGFVPSAKMKDGKVLQKLPFELFVDVYYKSETNPDVTKIMTQYEKEIHDLCHRALENHPLCFSKP